MSADWGIEPGLVERVNAAAREAHDEDYGSLGRRLARRGVHIDDIARRASALRIALPSWGLGTGGTRFGRFPGPGEPRDVFEKLDDCAVVHQLVRITPDVSLHIPWDEPGDARGLAAHAASRGLRVQSVNSNTFQDQPGQPHSYKFGSLTHTDAAVRRAAIDHNLHCLDVGRALGATAHTVWIGDGGNFPGQVHARHALDRYVDSLRQIHARLPDGWRLFIEHKLYEPAFYSTVLNDWGTSYWAACQIGDRCFPIVDLGHHAPNVNIEMIVARLLHFGRLGGFHFNDSRYGDDDLDTGAVRPFQLFLVFNELVDAELAGLAGFDPAYMLDQSHNVTDPIESLFTSATEVQRACVQAQLVDRAALADAQQANDALLALGVLKEAFTTDVAPILARARLLGGGALDPLRTYRASGYRGKVAASRPARAGAAASAGIV
jgi:L-rhamnose isomerase/sugar isomerase